MQSLWCSYFIVFSLPKSHVSAFWHNLSTQSVALTSVIDLHSLILVTNNGFSSKTVLY